MSTIISTLKKRHIEARNERALTRMIEQAGSQTMRDELISLSQRGRNGLNR